MIKKPYSIGKDIFEIGVEKLGEGEYVIEHSGFQNRSFIPRNFQIQMYDVNKKGRAYHNLSWETLFAMPNDNYFRVLKKATPAVTPIKGVMVIVKNQNELIELIKDYQRPEIIISLDQKHTFKRQKGQDLLRFITSDITIVDDEN